MITLLVDRIPARGEKVEVVGDRYRHLCRARRVEVGAEIRLVDGRGSARWSRVESIDRRRTLLGVGVEAETHEPARRVELWAGALRATRASWLVEKTTELGVAAVRFFSSAHAARSYGDAGIARLRRVAEAAVEQCHRAVCPEISGVHEWTEVLELSAGWMLDVPSAEDPERHADAERSPVTPVTAPDGRLVVLVGPEGGWSSAERDELRAKGHRPLSLGSTTLRVETAGVVGVAMALEDAAPPDSPAGRC